MLEIDQVRLALVDYFVSESVWRESKAIQYPDDRRNTRSAKALRAVADYIANLPDDDQRLAAFARCKEVWSPLPEIVFIPPRGNLAGISVTNNFACRCGFDKPMEDSEAWFSEWFEMCNLEAIAAGYAGEQR